MLVVWSVKPLHLLWKNPMQIAISTGRISVVWQEPVIIKVHLGTAMWQALC